MEVLQTTIKEAIEEIKAIDGGMPFGHKFVVGERGEGHLELALHSKPPPGPSHKEIAEKVEFEVLKARGGTLMVSLEGDGLKYVEGYSTTLPSGGADETDFLTALAGGVLWLVR